MKITTVINSGCKYRWILINIKAVMPLDALTLFWGFQYRIAESFAEYERPGIASPKNVTNCSLNLYFSNTGFQSGNG